MEKQTNVAPLQPVEPAPMQPVGPAPGGGWKKPWVAYNIIDRPGMKNRIWSRVGTAWLNRDGSINVFLDSFPLGGKINIREDDRDTNPRFAQRGALSVAADQGQGGAESPSHKLESHGTR